MAWQASPSSATRPSTHTGSRRRRYIAHTETSSGLAFESIAGTRSSQSAKSAASCSGVAGPLQSRSMVSVHGTIATTLRYCPPRMM